jgi:hypothetical protein
MGCANNLFLAVGARERHLGGMSRAAAKGSAFCVTATRLTPRGLTDKLFLVPPLVLNAVRVGYRLRANVAVSPMTGGS